jgi:hypothetical protein
MYRLMEGFSGRLKEAHGAGFWWRAGGPQKLLAEEAP